MKNKILLAVLILFIFTVPSCAELSGLTLCKIKQNGEPYATPLGRVPDPFADMIANPNSQAWTVCANVVGLWNYRDRYLKNIDDVKASDIINRTVEISDLMLQNNYNQNDRSEERYFHFLSEINSALCAQTGTCNGKKKTKWGPNGYLVVIRDDNKQPQNGVTPEEATARTVEKFHEGGSGDGDGPYGSNGSGSGYISKFHINYFR